MKVKSFTFNPFQENTYIIYDKTKECIIVDPGCYTEKEQETLKQFIITENLIKAEINYIIAGNATNTLYIQLKKTIIISTKKLKNIVFSDYKDTSIEIVADCGCPLSLVLNKVFSKY